MQPIALNDAILLFLMFIVFGIPAVALAVRLASKPIVDAIVRFREAFNASQAVPADARVAALEQEVQRLAQEVTRLAESDAFYRELVSAKPAELLKRPEDGH